MLDSVGNACGSFADVIAWNWELTRPRKDVIMRRGEMEMTSDFMLGLEGGVQKGVRAENKDRLRKLDGKNCL